MNASLVNTTPHHHHHHGRNEDVSSRLQHVPVTPRRKLQIPSVFETTPDKKSSSPSKPTNSPGKLKIPSVFADLKALKPPGLDEQVEVKIISSPVSPVVDVVEDSAVRARCWESQSEGDQSLETVKTANPTRSRTIRDTAVPGKSKAQRKIRKQRSNKVTLKQQLLNEIAVLQKEIHEVSLRAKIRENSVARNKSATAEAPPVRSSKEIKATITPTEIEYSTCDLDLVLSHLDESARSNDTDIAIAADQNRKPSSHQASTIVTAIDSDSIQSPRTKTRTMKKLRSFFRRRKVGKTNRPKDHLPTF
jgi:hypothetical protein